MQSLQVSVCVSDCDELFSLHMIAVPMAYVLDLSVGKRYAVHIKCKNVWVWKLVMQVSQ